MPLDALPNENPLQVFMDLYPLDTFEYRDPADLANETLYPPQSFLRAAA